MHECSWMHGVEYARPQSPSATRRCSKWIRRADRHGEVHGLDLVDALAGAGNWGIDGDPEHGRITWVRVGWPTGCPAGRKDDTEPGADQTRRCA